jgi:serine/alanine adding enzyme
LRDLPILNPQVELFQGSGRQAWDDYVLQHDQGTLYHLSGWQQVISLAYKRPTYYWWCRNSVKEVMGVLPTVHLKHPLFGNSLVSMPYLDGGGILADTSPVCRQLQEAATELAYIKSISQIELHYLYPNPVHQDLPGGSNTAENPKVRMVLPLGGNSQELFKSFKAKLRSQIRKPEKAGLCFAIGGLDRLDDFYQVFVANMRDLGSPVHSSLFFHRLLEAFEIRCQVGVVYHGNQPVAAGIIFQFRDFTHILWASSLRSFNHLSPNMMLYWQFLKVACDGGYKFFDFGRSTLGSGTYKFKEQWGAAARPLFWENMNFTGKMSRARTKDQFSLLIKVWQKIPVPLTKIIGPIIRRYISL